MLLTRTGFPEEGEFVLCTVTNIQYNSVFVKLNEYEKSGLIHISEISPGRIRNIRDFVVEGKVVVCVVLRINQERGYIDLSLRRVNEREKKKTIEKIKQEQKAEKIIENFAAAKKIDIKFFYKKISQPILKNYAYIHSAFFDVVEKKTTLEKLGVPQDVAEEFEKVILEKIKPKTIFVEATLKLEFYQENGVELLKNALSKYVNKNVSIKYEGGGKYRILIVSKEYKDAENMLKEIRDDIEKYAQKYQAFFEFKRIEKK